MQKKDEDYIEQYLDVDGFVLLAGPNTAVIAKGTLRECRTALVTSGSERLFTRKRMLSDLRRSDTNKLLKEKRDPYCGKGEYAIVHLKSAQKIEGGHYNKFTAYQDSVYELDLPDPAATPAR